ncbi:MAG: peptidoglycan DD-metalloendopeptidase family protein [Amphritea sp.]|nr:peptidoglycan DD-metalloendopeptidase family protein [Amphritea sp.]
MPVTHMLAATICVVIISFTAALLPSSDASARSGQPLPLPTAEISNSQEATAKVAQPAQSQPETATVAASQPEPTQVVPPEPENWQDFKIRSGDTLTAVFKRAGLTVRDVFNVTAAVKGTEVLRRIYPGQTLSFVIEEGQLKKLKHIQNKMKSALITRTDEGYEVDNIERDPEIIPAFAEGTIENSLFYDASQAGLSDKMIMELAAVFGWDIDFVLDLREGDSFSMVYEKKYLDGSLIGEGEILAAEFTNRGNTYTAIRYTDSDGSSSYFSPEGGSMRKAFLRSPVDFARISSSFKTRRKHPVLGLTRAHKGTDYAARTGTPIKAAGEGKIIWRGTKGGYGKCVIVQHGGNITTLYAHMNNYRKGQRVGTRVKQGQVIGYVGKTGLASGPHLHYEFRVNGVHKNPQTVKLPHAAPIAKAERERFFSVAKEALAQLESHKATQLASRSN